MHCSHNSYTLQCRINTNEAKGSFLHCFMITWWLSYFPCLLNMTSSEWRYKIWDKNYFKLLQTFAYIKRKHFAVRMVLTKPSFQTEYAVLDKADLLWRERPRWNCSSYSCLCCGPLPRWEAHTSDLNLYEYFANIILDNISYMFFLFRRTICWFEAIPGLWPGCPLLNLIHTIHQQLKWIWYLMIWRILQYFYLFLE